MKKAEQRQIAIRAARHILRGMGCLDHEMSIKDAEKVLDELATTNPDRIAAQWFVNATDYQWGLFRKEWKKNV